MDIEPEDNTLMFSYDELLDIEASLEYVLENDVVEAPEIVENVQKTLEKVKNFLDMLDNIPTYH